MAREPAIKSQGKIENANRVTKGVCRAMWLSLENLLQEKLASDCILIAWLIRHAAWSLTRFRVKNDGRTAFGESIHEPSVALWRKGDVQVHGRADKQSGSEMGSWYLGRQSANDRRTHSLTESGVEKAKSLHRVPLEEKFVINELEVRGLLWNSRAETLKATIVTQQDQGPSGHRRVYLTTNVVARFGATTGRRVCVGPHTEGC